MNARIGSLFSGYGGLDRSVIEALGGGQVVWHSDIKPASIALLEHHYPDVPNLGDILNIDYNAAAPIDVLAASWPCQPHSAAGKRLGEKDPRALWPCVVRAVEETRPAIFFGENVARIATNGELRRVVRSLTRLGYVGAWRSLRASDIGACHRRDRMFVVAADPESLGWLERWAGDAGQLGRPDVAVSGDGLRHLNLLPIPTARDVHGPGAQGREGGLNLRSAIALLPTPGERLGGQRGSPSGETAIARMASGRRNLDDAVMAMLATPTARDWKDNGDFTVNARRRSLPHQIKELSDVAYADRWGKYAEAIALHEQVFGRPAPEPTQISQRNGKPQLSARFVEFMMGLPEGWVTDIPTEVLVDSPRKSVRNAQLSLLGDGVVPAQGAAAFSFLLGHLAQRLADEEAA